MQRVSADMWQIFCLKIWHASVAAERAQDWDACGTCAIKDIAAQYVFNECPLLASQT